MKAGSLLALLVVISLMGFMSMASEDSTSDSTAIEVTQQKCYDLVSFTPVVLTDGNLTWIDYFEDVVVVDEQGDTVDARTGVGAHNIGWKRVSDGETLRLCRSDSLNSQWTMKIPWSMYENLIAGPSLR